MQVRVQIRFPSRTIRHLDTWDVPDIGYAIEAAASAFKGLLRRHKGAKLLVKVAK